MKFSLFIIGLSYSLTAFAQDWDLTDIVKNEKQWQKEVSALEKKVPLLNKCKGLLGTSAKKLQECLDNSSELQLQTSKICTWAWLNRSNDSLNQKNVENAQRCSRLFSMMSENMSYFSPEILQIGDEKIQQFLKENAQLSPYSQLLREILKSAPHILSSEQEEVLNAFNPVFRKSSETFRFLLDVEIPWSTAKMSDGEQEINVSNYIKYRQSDNREDRQKAFKSFYTTLNQYERTFGSTLGQNVIKRNIEARVRKYNNSLHQALSEENLPEAVYTTLISEVNRSLPTLHNYLKLRQKMSNIKDLGYEDMYTNVMKAPKTFSLEETKNLTLASTKVLGEDYSKKITEGTSKNWMSVYPKKGKSSGAFMSGSAYGVHPYILLNHLDDYNSASTYTHEWGHALHTILSQETQPYAKSNYSIFIGEIPAILNEILLNDYALKNATSKEEKIFYLNEALESLRTTYFRQAQFAEFELAIHQEAENGVLTGQKISEIYGKIQRKYYGHDKKVVNVDPLYFNEWMFVGHFYGGFYVYKYATAITGAYYFADQILNGNKEVLEKYLQLLKAGGSKYPHELLLDAGLDLSKKEPYRVLEKRAKSYIEQIEKLSR